MAVISTGLLTAQNSRVVSSSEKENKTFEKNFSDRTTNMENPDIKQNLPVFVKQDDRGRVIESDKTARTVSPGYKHERPEIKSPESLRLVMLNNDEKMQKREIKPSIVRKSSRDDVATVTFKVVGNPIPPEYGGPGFHLILDADAEMIFQDTEAQYEFEYENFVYDFEYNWSSYYAKCEYKIPENASPNLNNPNALVDDEASIYIPSGIYDYIFCYPQPYKMGWWQFKVNGMSKEDPRYRYSYLSWADDFEFKAGYEYVFIAGYSGINLISEVDAKIIEVIPPFKSTALTNQEEIKAVVANYGNNDIIGYFNLSYRVNKSEWTEPETF